MPTSFPNQLGLPPSRPVPFLCTFPQVLPFGINLQNQSCKYNYSSALIEPFPTPFPQAWSFWINSQKLHTLSSSQLLALYRRTFALLAYHTVPSGARGVPSSLAAGGLVGSQALTHGLVLGTQLPNATLAVLRR